MNARSIVPMSASLDAGSTTLWAIGAILLGCALALSGLPGLYCILAVAALIVFAGIALRYPAPTMSASIWLLALCPFSVGITTGVLPKLFGDEFILLPYLLAFPFLYLSRSRTWRPGFSKLYWVLGFLVVTQSLSLLVATNLVAFRNFLETDVLGALLLVLFLQESVNAPRMELFANSIIWLTTLIAALSVVERVTQRNPLMEFNTTTLYLSPLLAALTQGVYRPYVTFFHPSEAGTFMALGVPFALRRWSQSHSWLSLALIGVIAAGVVVNATRGDWVAIAVATLLLARRPLLILLYAIPTASIGAALAYVALQSTPFMKRLTDPNNFYSRLVYWGLALKVFSQNIILGVGHMQFQYVYLNYVHDLSNVAHFDIAKIFAIDNMYLITLVEHGIVGFISLIILFIFLGVSLATVRKRLVAAQLLTQATFVRAAELALVTYAVAGCFADINQFTKCTKFFFIIMGFGFGIAARYVPTSSANRDRRPLCQGVSGGSQ